MFRASRDTVDQAIEVSPYFYRELLFRLAQTEPRLLMPSTHINGMPFAPPMRQEVSDSSHELGRKVLAEQLLGFLSIVRNGCMYTEPDSTVVVIDEKGVLEAGVVELLAEYLQTTRRNHHFKKLLTLLTEDFRRWASDYPDEANSLQIHSDGQHRVLMKCLPPEPELSPLAE